MVKDTDSVVKKRKKTSTSPAKTNSVPPKVEEVDIYQAVVDFEENEAKTRNPEADHELYKKTLSDFRTIMNDMAELKLQNTEKSKAEIREKHIQGSLLFVILKKLNRLEKFRTRDCRETLNNVKQQVDRDNLQLQNLLYEIMHLKKEVNKCLQFKSKDEEIELVPLEEFYKEAPASISRPEVTKNDEHQVRLAQLEWELQQRKHLSSLCQKMEESKKESAKEIIAKREQLDSLSPQLKSVLDQTETLQDFLGLPLAKIKQQHRAARLLPIYLYELYAQADAYKQGCDPLVSVVIHGDEEQAQNVSPEPQSFADDDSGSEVENSMTQESNSGRRRKTSTKLDRLEARRAQLIKAHPLTLEVSLKLPDGNAIVLTFSYLVNLKLITVQVKVEATQQVHGIAAGDLIAAHRILASLVPGDTGATSPNLSTRYQLRRVGLDSWPSDLGIPYIWAQRLGGIEMSDRSTKHPLSYDMLFRKIKRRLKGRLELCQQIQQLEGGTIPVPAEMRCKFSAKLCSSLRDFKAVPWEDYVKIGHTANLVAANLSEPEDSFYKAVFVRGSAKLTALITIKADFPKMAALFCLRLQWDGDHTANNSLAIRDLECEMNVHRKESPELLSAQLLRLQASLDILLETSCATVSSTEFPRDKVFFRAVRGRERAVPYKYLAEGGGVFTHR